MSDKILVFANDTDQAEMLISGAAGLGSSIILISSDQTVRGADEIYLYPAESSVASVLEAIVNLIAKEKPQLVLCESSADGKLVAGFAAITLGTAPICDATNLKLWGDGVECSRIVYGGSATAVMKAPFPAVAVMSAGAFEKKAVERDSQLRELPISADALSPCSVERSAPAKAVNLSAAKAVVGVGRGICSADNLPYAEKLAEKLGAEIGCTRPVSEEEHWYGKERYIGVSGCMIKPNLYFALGISGQVQHMVGVNQSGVIFALDKSENAPIVKQADYVLIGDVNTALPKLLELLS